MRADRRHRYGAGLSGQLLDQGQRRAGGVAGAAQRGEEPEVDAEAAGQVPVPVTGARVDELRGGGVGELGALLPREPVRDQVRDQQEPLRGGELGSVAGGRELVERVEGGVLDAGRPVEVLGRDRGPHLLRDSFGAAVAVVDGVAEEGPVGVEQPVVHRPAVDAQGVDRAGRAQPVEHPRWRPRTSQRRPSGRCTGRLGKRWTSVRSRVSGPTRPTMTRPLEAPRSAAARICGRALIAGRPRRPRRRRGCGGRWCG